MITASIRSTGAAVRRFQRLQSSIGLHTARGLNRAIRSLRTVASTAIRQEVALKKRYVDGKLRIRKATKTNPVAKISATSRGILLSRFPHRQLYRKGKTVKRKRAGVSVKVSPKHGYKKMRRAFIVPKLKGSQVPGIAVRKRGVKREPILVLHGPSVSQVFDSLRDDLAPQGRERAREEVQQQIDRFVVKKQRSRRR